jgi:hypothetical protein
MQFASCFGIASKNVIHASNFRDSGGRNKWTGKTDRVGWASPVIGGMLPAKNS